jgi:hypothetical protein
VPYKVFNAAMATTAATAKVTTGTSIKTMLQVATPATRQIQIISWGYTCDGAPSSASVAELIQTDVAATVTAHVAAGIQPVDPNGTPSLCVGGTALTGYTASAEGTTTASRLFDAVEIPPSSSGAPGLSYYQQFMPDERPIVPVSKFLRVRVTFGSAVNMLCWVTFTEVG